MCFITCILTAKGCNGLSKFEILNNVSELEAKGCEQTGNEGWGGDGGLGWVRLRRTEGNIDEGGCSSSLEYQFSSCFSSSLLFSSSSPLA